MDGPSTSVTRNDENNQSNLSVQTWKVAQVFWDSIFLLLKVIYYILEALCKAIFPIARKSVKGEIVLVTGAGHGIGKELAFKYASEGATVVAWDVNKETCEETVREIGIMGYPKAYAYTCDVANYEEVIVIARRVEKEVGDVSIIVNNAGIMPAKPLLDHDPEEIEKIFKINVFAHFWIIKAFLPRMLQNNKGHIVALSSCAGLMGFRNLVPYCGSKFAVRGFMEALYEETGFQLNSQIKYTVIYPYMVDTGLCKKPRIRFAKLMPLLSPKYVAEYIVDAQRKDVTESTIPGYIYYLNLFGRSLPVKGATALKEFFDSGVDAAY